MNSKTDWPIHLGWSIAYWRESRGLTAAEVAMRSGLNESDLAKIENDMVKVTEPTAKKIADAMGVSLFVLLASKEND